MPSAGDDLLQRGLAVGKVLVLRQRAPCAASRAVSTVPPGARATVQLQLSGPLPTLHQHLPHALRHTDQELHRTGTNEAERADAAACAHLQAWVAVADTLAHTVLHGDRKRHWLALALGLDRCCFRAGVLSCGRGASGGRGGRRLNPGSAGKK